MPSLFLRDATRVDLAEAFRWYEGRRLGLALRLGRLDSPRLNSDLLLELRDCGLTLFRSPGP